MTITFVPPSGRAGNAVVASLHPLPHRVDHPSPLLLLADDAQLGQGGKELGGRCVGRDQDAGAGGGGEDGDEKDFGGHKTNLSAASFSVRVCSRAALSNSRRTAHATETVGGESWR